MAFASLSFRENCPGRDDSDPCVSVHGSPVDRVPILKPAMAKSDLAKENDRKNSGTVETVGGWGEGAGEEKGGRGGKVTGVGEGGEDPRGE